MRSSHHRCSPFNVASIGLFRLLCLFICFPTQAITLDANHKSITADLSVIINYRSVHAVRLSITENVVKRYTKNTQMFVIVGSSKGRTTNKITLRCANLDVASMFMRGNDCFCAHLTVSVISGRITAQYASLSCQKLLRKHNIGGDVVCIVEYIPINNM